MCGIIGYTGKKQAEDILLESLELLEYRGYDSAGIAVADTEEKRTQVVKCAGRVKDLEKLCNQTKLSGTAGIGHTRWATHGGVSDVNAHPHKRGQVTLVHNGIVENYHELIQKYGLDMISETDTEVVAAMLDCEYKGNPYEAITKVVTQLKGTYALVIMFEDHPDEIYAIRKVSPIVVAVTEEGSYLASDVTAIGAYTKQYFVMPELCILTLKGAKAEIVDLNQKTVEPKILTIDWDLNKDGKDGYPFYMEKEIMEQPEAIRRTISPRIKDGKVDFSKDQVADEIFTGCNQIYVIACGTAMHAGLVGKSLIQSKAKLKVDVMMASEFTYSEPIIDEKTLVIAVSQSGETIDTLEAIKYAKSFGAKVLSIVNVKETSIPLNSDYVIYTYAGPEIAVASTKAYTTQVSVFYLIAAKLAVLGGKMSEEEEKQFLRQIEELPEKVQAVLEKKQEIHKIAKHIVSAHDVFMIGRGMDYTALLEASLKLKEISYIHCEAYASGELKHGTIALVTSKTPVIALITQTKLKSKEWSNVREVQSRGAQMVTFVKEALLDEDMKKGITFVLPDASDEFMIIPSVVALQLLAYYVSSDKGLDVDKPRNLAKVVTVE